MTPDQLKQKLEEKMRRINDYASNGALTVIATEATNQFKENFDNESFDGKKWPEVERRKPESPWYGFDYETKPKHFLKKRTADPILKGPGTANELKEAISRRIEPGRVIMTNDKPYAYVHNYGGPAKIFGKTPFTMKQRQFMGVTPALIDRIKDKMKRDINNILKS